MNLSSRKNLGRIFKNFKTTDVKVGEKRKEKEKKKKISRKSDISGRHN